MAASARPVHLPSGRRVRVRTAQAQAPTSKKKAPRALFDETREALRTGALVVEDAKTKARLDDAAIDGLALAYFHVLRDFAIRSKLVPSEAEAITCDNCDTPLRFDGASLPLADLEDRYEGDAPPAERDVPLAEGQHVRMRPITLAEAAPLFRELARNRPFRITPALVRAMGIVRLTTGATTADEPRALARALADLDDERWSAVEAGFLALAYPARAISVLPCPKCETVHELEVPWPRELEPSQYHPRRDEAVPFPSAEEFEDHVARVAAVVFERMGVTGMTLRVEPGVPDVDAGGIPMLGCYGPEQGEDGRTEFVVTLFFRTFERSFRDDARFDWEHEVEETLEHEVQHHLYYLDGHDPMDEAERKETEADAIRRAGGKARLQREERAAVAHGLWGVVRTLGPVLFCLALAVVVFLRCS